ncbi:MAG: radical SAM protein [archaeon]
MNVSNRPKLEEVRISITEKCNLSCHYCYDVANPNHSPSVDKNISLEDIKYIVDTGKKQGLETMSFTGGEPLLALPLLTKAIAYCKSQGLRTGLLTNGTLITRATAKEIAEAGLSWARISLDGSCNEVNSRTRGSNESSFQTIVDAIDLFVEQGVPVILRPTITIQNYQDLENLVTFAIQHNVQKIDMQPYIPLGDGRDQKFIISSDEHAQIVDELMWLRGEYGRELEIVCYSGWFEFLFPSYDDVTPYLSRCGRGFIFVDHNGDIKPCAPTMKVLGNIHDRNFLKVFSKDPFLEKIRSPEAYGVCGTCDAFDGLCQQCPAPTYNMTGTLDCPPVLCPKARMEGEA